MLELHALGLHYTPEMFMGIARKKAENYTKLSLRNAVTKSILRAQILPGLRR